MSNDSKLITKTLLIEIMKLVLRKRAIESLSGDKVFQKWMTIEDILYETPQLYKLKPGIEDMLNDMMNDREHQLVISRDGEGKLWSLPGLRGCIPYGRDHYQIQRQ